MKPCRSESEVTKTLQCALSKLKRDADQRHSLSHPLRNRLTTLPDGWNAKRLTETTEPPDLVLLDISLPSLSGLDVLRAIRTTQEWQWIPVIVLSAETRPGTIVEATTLGATEYLKKPFSHECLMKAVEPFLPKPHD